MRERAAWPLNGFETAGAGLLGTFVFLRNVVSGVDFGEDVDSSEGIGLNMPVGSIEGVNVGGVEGKNGSTIASSNEYEVDPDPD